MQFLCTLLSPHLELMHNSTHWTPTNTSLFSGKVLCKPQSTDVRDWRECWLLKRLRSLKLHTI